MKLNTDDVVRSYVTKTDHEPRSAANILLQDGDSWDVKEKAAITQRRQENRDRARSLEWEPMEEPVGPIEEPVLPTVDLYNLGDAAQVTVNEYGAAILNSRNLAIADVDVKPATIAALAKYPECNPVYESLWGLGCVS